MRGQARVVVIGGGAVGASCLYHLTQAGVADCLLIEKDELPLQLVVPDSAARRVFTILRLPSHMFTIYDGVEAAIDALGQR